MGTGIPPAPGTRAKRMKEEAVEAEGSWMVGAETSLRASSRNPADPPLRPSVRERKDERTRMASRVEAVGGTVMDRASRTWRAARSQPSAVHLESEAAAARCEPGPAKQTRMGVVEEGVWCGRRRTGRLRHSADRPSPRRRWSRPRRLRRSFV